MSDASNPFETMMKVSQDWAKSMGPAMETLTPKAMTDFMSAMPTMSKDAMEAMMGRTFNPEGLDARTRLLLTLQGLTIAGAQAEPQITATVRHAVEAGATRQEIAETIALSAMFGGMPSMTKAMELAEAAMADDKDAET